MGFQQVSELLPVPVTFVGKLPDNLQYITRFAGAVTAHAEHPSEGKALLDYLASANAQETITATGMIPSLRRAITRSNECFQLSGNPRLNTPAAPDQPDSAFDLGLGQRNVRQEGVLRVWH